MKEKIWEIEIPELPIKQKTANIIGILELLACLVGLPELLVTLLGV